MLIQVTAGVLGTVFAAVTTTRLLTRSARHTTAHRTTVPTPPLLEPSTANDVTIDVYMLPSHDHAAAQSAGSVLQRVLPCWDRDDDDASAATTATHIVGLDAEWRPEYTPPPQPDAHTRRLDRTVTVLQVAGPGGVLVLRPHQFRTTFPPVLARLLSDPHVIKVGVGIQEDARRLAADWSVSLRGAVDLRVVAQTVAPDLVAEAGQSLAALCRALLGRYLDKSQQCSAWGKRHLSKAQLAYAAQDAWTSRAALLALYHLACTGQLPASALPGASEPPVPDPQLLTTFLTPFLDNFRMKSVAKAVHDMRGAWAFGATLSGSTAAGGRAPTRPLSPAVVSPASLGHAGHGARPPSQSKKPSRHALRKRNLYENCRIQAPDGAVLCTTSSKKVQWYQARGLGDIVCEDPLTLRLKFEPRGRGHADDAYYTSDKENQCVVCGLTTARGDAHSMQLHTAGSVAHEPGVRDCATVDAPGPGAGAVNQLTMTAGEGGEGRATRGAHSTESREAYLRHAVVPTCYRRCFPPEYKSHLSHDIVLLCLDCHQACSVLDQQRMVQIGYQYAAPLAEDHRRYTHDAQLASVRSAGRALTSKKGGLPEERRTALTQVVAQHYGVNPEHVTAELLEAAAKVDSRVPTGQWVTHAERVVACLRTEADIEQFVRGWRAHFLEVMQPRYLPPHWRVDARVRNSSYGQGYDSAREPSRDDSPSSEEEKEACIDTL